MKHHAGSTVPGTQRFLPTTRSPEALLANVAALVVFLIVCISLTSCTSGHDPNGGEASPNAKSFPAHLCGSTISTAPLRRIYPRGTAGPVQMTRDNHSTGNIHRFMNDRSDSGDSGWGCWIQFDGKKAESSLFEASIGAIAKGNPSSLVETRRLAGYHSHELTLGVIHGVNGPQHSGIEFPCEVSKNRNVTMSVSLFHPIDPDAADAYRERVTRISSGYIKSFARYVIDTLHLCKNLPKFPAGKFSSKPIPYGSSKPSGDGG